MSTVNSYGHVGIDSQPNHAIPGQVQTSEVVKT